MTVGERAKLIELSNDVPTEIYHLERIRSVLDAPKGYGLRLEFLRIPMCEEEQLAFWSAFNYDVTRQLIRNEQKLVTLDEKMDEVLARTRVIESSLERDRSSLVSPDPLPEDFEAPMGSLNLSTLCWLHRIVTEESYVPEVNRGRFRSVRVCVGTVDEVQFVPPPADEVPKLITALLEWWRSTYWTLAGEDRHRTIEVLTEFHYRVLYIHPFFDGNGRVARILLDQAARELLNQRIGREFTADAEEYFACLREANKGNLLMLMRRIAASLQ